jgi:hypothetical protein
VGFCKQPRIELHSVEEGTLNSIKRKEKKKKKHYLVAHHRPHDFWFSKEIRYLFQRNWVFADHFDCTGPLIQTTYQSNWNWKFLTTI